MHILAPLAATAHPPVFPPPEIARYARRVFSAAVRDPLVHPVAAERDIIV